MTASTSQPCSPIARQDRAKDLRQQLRVAKVRQGTSLRTLPKLTRVVNGRRRIVDKPPLIVHDARGSPAAMTEGYIKSLPPDRRPLLERYNMLDCARKVVRSAASALAAT